MNVTLPKKLNSTSEVELQNPKSIVVIGANGSGKTRFGFAIEDRYLKTTHRLSAQKSLTMPSFVSTSSKEKAESELWYGGWSDRPSDRQYYEKDGKKTYRWQNNPNTSLLNDFEKLMILLHTIEYEESLKFKEINKTNINAENIDTKIDTIISIWGKILPHRRLLKRAGVIEAATRDNSSTYNASEMSDGERVIFYLIGEVICAQPNCIIIIDEPEMHLHKSIASPLWDEIEKTRPDCLFIYLTHDVEFASSRIGSTKIWLKSYQGENIWDYEILDNLNKIPEDILFEILGSRKPILFVEGNDVESLDTRLYPYIFPEFTIKPLGSSSKVIEATKAFRELEEFHHIESVGIVDRDRKTEDDIQNLTNYGIHVPDVSEIENILLKESIIKSVANRLGKEPNEVFNLTKINIINKFRSELEYQAILFTKYILRRKVQELVSTKQQNIGELEQHINNIPVSLHANEIYTAFKIQFEQILSNDDYNAILKVYNQKGLLPESKVIQLCGLGNKKDYLFQLIEILKNPESRELRNELRGAFNFIPDL